MRGNEAAQRGYASEHLAVAHLIREGYEVYLGVGNTSCDLVAMRDGRVLRVEVKTLGKPNGLGKHWVQVHPDCFDMLAVITPDGSVVLDPPEALVGRRAKPARNRGSDGRRRV